MSEVEKLFHLRKAIFQMLNDRLYKVSHVDLDETVEDLLEDFGDIELPDDSANILTSYTWDGSEKIYVIFQGDKPVSDHVVEKHVKRMADLSVTDAIMVVSSSENVISSGKRAIAEYSPTYSFEIFTEFDLLLNPTRHTLQTRCKPLTPAQANEVLLKLHATINELPRIFVNDPMSRYYGLKRGDVVQMTRTDERGTKFPTYSVVT